MANSSTEHRCSSERFEYEIARHKQYRLALGMRCLYDTYNEAADTQASAVGETAALIAENSLEEIAVACILKDLSSDFGLKLGAIRPPDPHRQDQTSNVSSQALYGVQEQSDAEDRSDSMSPLEDTASRKKNGSQSLTPPKPLQAQPNKSQREQRALSPRRQQLLEMLEEGSDEEDEATTDSRRRSKRRKADDDFLRELGLQVTPAQILDSSGSG